jgi:hypothetical protein
MDVVPAEVEAAWQEYYELTASIRNVNAEGVGAAVPIEGGGGQQHQCKPLLIPGNVLHLRLKPGTNKWAEANTAERNAEFKTSCCQQQYEPVWIDGTADVLNTMAVSHFMLADHLPTKVAQCLTMCAATHESAHDPAHDPDLQV